MSSLRRRLRFPHEATVAGEASQDEFGTPTYSAASTLSVRIEPTAEVVRHAQGEVLIVAARLFAPWDAQIAPQARLTFEGQGYIVLQGGKVYDTRGTATHQEWLLGTI